MRGWMGRWMNRNPCDHHTRSWVFVHSVHLFPVQDHSHGWYLVPSVVSHRGAPVSLRCNVMEDQSFISFLALLHKVLYTAASDGNRHTYIKSSLRSFPVGLSGRWPLPLESRVLALVPRAMCSGSVAFPAFRCHRGSFQGRIVWSLFTRQAERC